MASPKTILVVDDDPAIHHLLKTVMAPPEWRVECAYDGMEGLACVKAKEYDLVLTDLRMPGMDGLELLRKIREERAHLRVLVMTADNTPDNILCSLREHAFGYFSKPFTPDAALEVIEQALATTAGDDDIQVLSALPNWVALEVHCRLEVADRLLQFLSEMKTGLPEKERDDVAFAFREMLRNAIEHGGKCDPNQTVYVSYIRSSKAILYLIRDPGEGFRFDALPHAAISYPDDQPGEHMEHRMKRGLRPGGFGILLARKLVDELMYNEQGNEVILFKYLE